MVELMRMDLTSEGAVIVETLYASILTVGHADLFLVLQGCDAVRDVEGTRWRVWPLWNIWFNKLENNQKTIIIANVKSTTYEKVYGKGNI